MRNAPVDILRGVDKRHLVLTQADHVFAGRRASVRFVVGLLDACLGEVYLRCVKKILNGSAFVMCDGRRRDGQGGGMRRGRGRRARTSIAWIPTLVAGMLRMIFSDFITIVVRQRF